MLSSKSNIKILSSIESNVGTINPIFNNSINFSQTSVLLSTSTTFPETISLIRLINSWFFTCLLIVIILFSNTPTDNTISFSFSKHLVPKFILNFNFFFHLSKYDTKNHMSIDPTQLHFPF